jgi:hypothetical protein
MANDRIAVPYNHRLTRLETLLAGVKRAGDFFVQGSLDAPIPRADIDGVGVLSFPVPASQIEAVIKRAYRAPYGRGEHTIVDTSIRNAWQLDSADVRIGGKAWEKTFNQIMSTVIAGLGCSGTKVSAKLHKLLVYETGGLSHHDVVDECLEKRGIRELAEDRQRDVARRPKGGRIVLQPGSRSRAIAPWSMRGSSLAPRPRTGSRTRSGVAERLARLRSGRHRGAAKTAETHRCI